MLINILKISYFFRWIVQFLESSTYFYDNTNLHISKNSYDEPRIAAFYLQACLIYSTTSMEEVH